MGFPNISDPSTQAMLNVPFSARTPSRVVQILNMCSIEDLMDDVYFKDLHEDVNEEASKFGFLVEIDIPRPDPVSFLKFCIIILEKWHRWALLWQDFHQVSIFDPSQESQI
jgi:hypothetical protein